MSRAEDSHVPLVRQIEAVRKQIAHLNNVYDRLIARGDSAGAGDALREIYEMQAVLTTIRRLYTQQHPEIGFAE